MKPRLKKAYTRFQRALKWIWRAFLTITLLFALRSPTIDNSRAGKIRQALTGYEFNYVSWEINALWEKFQQDAFGYHAFIDTETGKTLVIDYLIAVGDLQRIDGELERLLVEDNPANNAYQDELSQQRETVIETILDLQPLVEPIIEDQVEAVLRDLGFDIAGQVVPPVSFRFVVPPDILVVSPRNIIQQDFTFSLQPISPTEIDEIETRVSANVPDDAVRITPIGGVGIFPAMVDQTRFAAFAYEIVAHEWSHHYLFLYPLGQQYLVLPETRIINETAATIFGNEVGLMVLERFYRDEVAQGRIFVPNYPTLQDFFPSQNDSISNPNTLNYFDRTPIDSTQTLQDRVQHTAAFLSAVSETDAAQDVLDTWSQAFSRRGIRIGDNDMLDRGTVINRTRVTADFLLANAHIEAAEDYMLAQGQRLGIRRMNQAWFAFYGGYQAAPTAGGGVDIQITDVTDPNYQGDPIGPALQELMELAPTPFDYLEILRDVTTRQALIETLIDARQHWH